MKKILNNLISLFIFFLIVSSSWAIEYYFHLTKFYKEGSEISAPFKVLAINDKRKAISPENITVLSPFISNTNEYLNLFKEMHSNYTLALPRGKYSLSKADQENQKMDIKIESKESDDGVEIAFDLFTDDYHFFSKYKIIGDKIHPLRSSIVGLGSGFMTLLYSMVGFVVYKIFNKIFGIRQKLLKLFFKEDTG